MNEFFLGKKKEFLIKELLLTGIVFNFNIFITSFVFHDVYSKLCDKNYSSKLNYD